MLPRLSGLRPRAASAALLAVLLAPAVAAAADDKTISGSETLDGDQVYNHFTVEGTGTLSVTKLSTDPMNGGWLKIAANVITIKAGAILVADGAGYTGVDGDNGGAPPNSNGGGGKGAMPGVPGGGGGFFGAGANGGTEATMGTCVDSGAASPGGMAFFDMMLKTPSPGAAGGAANLAPIAGTAGGDGGGVVMLSAALIAIDGMLSANGGKPFANGGVGPGGGAAGTIAIVTASLTGAGTLQVLGGAGAHGDGSANPAMPITPNNGGGGSGGVLLFSLPLGMSPPASLQQALAGGATGDCAAGAPAGMMISDPLANGCVDLDGDGFTSSLCPGNPGTDCDDTDPTIHPGAKEICDGKDNDCNGLIDDGDDLCSPGSACVAGSCVALPDAGPGDAGPDTDGGPAPDHLEFGGGCALPAAPGEGLPEGAAAVVAFGLGALTLAASRRRPRRRRR